MSLVDELRDGQLWGRIRRSAETDPILKEMLEQIKVYYELRYGKQADKKGNRSSN